MREPRVDRHPNTLTHPYRTERGEWYVSRDVSDSAWEGEQHEYLHFDGVWRTSTFCNEKPTGYFRSEEEAKAALAKACCDSI